MPLYKGDEYIPTRKEIRRHFDRCKMYAEDGVANGEIKPEDAERWTWRAAIASARFTDHPAGKYWPVPANDFQSRYPASCRKEVSQSMN